MFNKKTSHLKAAVKRSVHSMMKQESDDWPPKCGIILYQPQRPKKEVATTEDKKIK